MTERFYPAARRVWAIFCNQLGLPAAVGADPRFDYDDDQIGQKVGDQIVTATRPPRAPHEAAQEDKARLTDQHYVLIGADDPVANRVQDLVTAIEAHDQVLGYGRLPVPQCSIVLDEELDAAVLWHPAVRERLRVVQMRMTVDAAGQPIPPTRMTRLDVLIAASDPVRLCGETFPDNWADVTCTLPKGHPPPHAHATEGWLRRDAGAWRLEWREPTVYRTPFVAPTEPEAKLQRCCAMHSPSSGARARCRLEQGHNGNHAYVESWGQGTWPA